MTVGVNRTWATRALNAVRVLLVVALTVVVFRLGWSALAPLSSPASPAARVNLSQPAPVRERMANATLLMVLGTDCPYCEQNMLFYQALLSTRRFGGFRAVAVFDEPVSLASEYLNARELAPDEIRQTKLADIGALGTPTLTVLDERGRVRKSWPGLLSGDAQREIVDMLDVRIPFQSAARAADRRKRYQDAVRARRVSPEEFAIEFVGSEPPLVVDTRERAAFRRSHIKNAVNIPFDELPTRAPIELPKDRKTLLFCQYEMACEERLREHNALTYCTLAASALFRAGVSEVGLLTANLEKVRAANVPLVASEGFSLARAPVRDRSGKDAAP